MPLSRAQRPHTLNGVLLVFLFALAATGLAHWQPVAALGISPLITGMVIGLFYGNTLRSHLPAVWTPGIVFSAKTLLRLGIVLYGFRLTFDQLLAIGAPGLLLDILMLSSTFLIGAYAGIKWLKLDRDTALLTASGSAVCGAAAVLATEPVLKAQPHKSAAAVSTVVLFGTLAMFLYPALYKVGWFDLSLEDFGLFLGASVHEVAHVVAAGNAISPQAAQSAVVAKMGRVILLMPLLLILGWWIARQERSQGHRTAIAVPWFAFGFLAVTALHSMLSLPAHWIDRINDFDTFLLTMAMTALGMETHLGKLKSLGAKPFLLAGIFFVWLSVGGYALAKWLL